MGNRWVRDALLRARVPYTGIIPERVIEREILHIITYTSSSWYAISLLSS